MRSLVATTLAVVLGAGCATTLGHKIDKVEFAGNRHVDDDTLLDGLHHQPDSWWPWSKPSLYDADALASDARHVQSHLVALGWRDARVVGQPLNSPGADWVDVRFDVSEGEPTRIASVRVERAPGDRGPDVDPDLLGVRAGEQLDLIKYREGKEHIRQEQQKRGYFHAQVSGKIILADNHRATIVVVVDNGPLVHFGVTTIEGAHRVPEADVLAQVAWREGDLFDPALVDLTKRRLYTLARFASVSVGPPTLAPGERPATLHMIIEVHETQANEARLGFGAAFNQIDEEVHLTGGLARRGLGRFLPMGTVRVDGLVAVPFLVGPPVERLPLIYKVAGSFIYDDLIVTRLRGSITADYSQQVTQTYTLTGPRLSASLNRGFFTDHLLLGLGWEGRRQDDSPDDAVSDALRAQVGLVDPYHEASYQQTVTLDLRDDLVEPRKGFYSELHFQEGGRFAGGDFDYVKVTPDARVYAPLGGRVVLALRGRLGLGFGRNGDPVPITERYFAGGPNSQRGFAALHLSPFATGGDGKKVPIGGEAELETSAELRIDLFRLSGIMMQGLVFLDGADVTMKRADLGERNLHWATGVGLGANTPVGPVRVGGGYRLNRTEYGEPDAGTHWSFFLTLGEAY